MRITEDHDFFNLLEARCLNTAFNCVVSVILPLFVVWGFVSEGESLVSGMGLLCVVVPLLFVLVGIAVWRIICHNVLSAGLCSYLRQGRRIELVETRERVRKAVMRSWRIQKRLCSWRGVKLEDVMEKVLASEG